MLVSEAVVDRLAAHGVRVAFGIPGTQTLPLNEAIEGRGDLRFVMARHETAVSHQAWGYATVTGEPAATIVIPGPGDLNATNGLKNAHNDCVPLLHLSVETDPDLRGSDAIHETPPVTYDPLVKSNVTIERPGRVAATIERSLAIATAPPAGPVRVGIPKPFLGQEVRQVEVDRFEAERATGVPEGAVAAAAERLSAADRPVIIAGGGIRAAGAGERLLRLAERLDAPVATTYKGKGAVPEDHELAVGVLGGASSAALLDLLADADAALAVGTDLDAVMTRGGDVELPATLVHITVDPEDLGTLYEPTVGIVADATAGLEALHDRIDAAARSPVSGTSRAAGVRDALEDRLEPQLDDRAPLSSPTVIRTLREVLPRDVIVSLDAGGFRLWTLATFPVYDERGLVTPGSWATMGTGLPGAIGAALGAPDRPVVALTGDGGLFMCLHELHTLAVEDLPVLVVVLNNDDYAIISDEAVRAYGLEAYAWPARSASFVDVAEGLGVPAVRAETPPAIADAIDDRLPVAGPALVEIPTDPEEAQVSEALR